MLSMLWRYDVTILRCYAVTMLPHYLVILLGLNAVLMMSYDVMIEFWYDHSWLKFLQYLNKKNRTCLYFFFIIIGIKRLICEPQN